MASTHSDTLVALALQNQAIAAFLLKNKQKERSTWVHELWMARQEKGHFSNLIAEMRLHDHTMHFCYFRMLPETFDNLLRIVGPLLTKEKSHFRDPLSPGLRLAVALRYLATGESQASLSFNFRIGRSTVCHILDEVPNKIWAALSPTAVAFPSSTDEWVRISNDFWHLWGFPLCLGAIDGKHCVINCPSNSGSSFYNYKGTFSLVLMAVVDASYMFTYVDVGDYGRQSDSGVFGNTHFGKSLHNGSLCLPQDDCLPNVLTKARYCFIGDEAFPLKDNVQRPYPGKNLPEKLRIYNYRLSRARRVVENAFGILSSRWRFLRSPIQMQPQKASKSILAAIALHNWLKKHNDCQQSYGRLYCPTGYVDYEDCHGIIHKGTWRSDVCEAGALPEINQIGPNNYTKAAEQFRALMAEYFVSPQGQLPWQYDYVRRTSYAPVQ